MKKTSKQFIDILIRYAILIIVALPNFWLFYLIFTPLTIYPIYFLLSLFFDPSLVRNIIFIDEFPIELIPACIAGSAYYLLLILNLSTPKIKLKKRAKMILFSFTSLLILNILRIFLLSLVFVSGNSLFDIAHKLFWYLGSTIFVVGIWFIEVKLFKIKEIPFYSDMKFLYKKSKLKK
jgi:exosortase/archaeosortase family protein